ncbi:coiled-coil domain-containing protein 22 homolog [Leptinotarsa decemlineata]|uniref:coiled-coil domain-containing protein 22 homolog n=1 Tax=Leptinotarsa decemlineata TaxID=7539 RepID=UPI000C253BDB|nr:coiled-coil domain-containing protein 22 [Leptinotarsa decemlineata]
MEEVDKIIIESLKTLECELGDIKGLREFNADMVVSALSSCLEAITPNTIFPKKLPPSMSARLKVATNLSDHIKELGFRGDMGYQTILYCNEIEIRRVLMFLIERLPRDTSKTTANEQTGYVARLIQSIEENIKNSLEEMWVPSCFVSKGIRECRGGYIVVSTGDSSPLMSQSLEVPNSKIEREILKQYWVHNLPDVTKQCSPKNLIPSLLFKDIEFSRNSRLVELIKKKNQTTELPDTIEKIILRKESPEKILDLEKKITTTRENENHGEKKLKILLDEIERVKSEYITLQDNAKADELQLSQVVATKNDKQNKLKESLAKLKLKTKTLAIINKEENMVKLKSLVQNAHDRLEELAKQWNEIQTPLLEEYNSLKNSLTSEEAKFQEDQQKLTSTRETYKKLVEDLNEKTVLEQSLSEKCKQLNRTNNRSAYTRRILEIIGNIRKQNVEIEHILKDTRTVQKDINNLTGQVDRSFTLSDELIFFDAKNDETARKAYKLLAALRDECSNILKAVTDIGLAERESRNLQEQIESEKSKEIGVKLDRVYSDLTQIQRETEMLIKNSQVSQG